MKIKYFFSFMLVTSLLLCNCKNVHEAKEPVDIGSMVFGGGDIIFDKKSVVVNAKKNKVSFNSDKKSEAESMEINGITTIINNDTTHFLNEKIPHIDRQGIYTQTFYFYRDTVCGDWYTAIHRGRKIIVKVDENKTGYERKLLIGIIDGNVREGLTVTQKAEK